VRKNRAISLMSSLVVLVVSSWQVLNAMGPKGIPYPVFGMVSSISLLLLISFLFFYITENVPKGVLVIIGWSLFSFFITGLGLIWWDWRSFYSALNDYAGILLFTSCLMVWIGFGSRLIKSYNLVLMGAVLLLAGVLAPLAAAYNFLPDFYWGGRYDPPHYFLALLLGVLASGRGVGWSKKLIAWMIFLFLVLPLSYGSGSRTFLLLSLVLFFIPVFLRVWVSTRAEFKALLVISFVLLSIGGGVLMLDSVEMYVSESRFSSFQSGHDESLFARLLEIDDVLYGMWESGNPLVFLFGAGAGATWSAINSYPAMNFLDDGRIYYIHFTPIAFLFRFGLLGMFLYLWLLYNAMKAFLGRAVLKSSKSSESYEFIIALGALMVLMNGFMRTFMNDVTGVFLVSGLVWLIYFQKISKAKRF